MALHHRPEREDNSLRGIVSRAFGSRPPRSADDPAPELDEVLTDLHVSEQEHGEPFEIDRIDGASSARSGGEVEAHRRRLEQLLESARHIEEQLAKEAAQAQALSQNLRLDEKRAVVAEAAEKEQRALAQAQAYAQNSKTAQAYQAKVAGELAAARQEMSAAEAAVRELQARLADAQNLVVLSNAKIVDAEAKSKEAAKRADMAQSLERDAECRVAKCREDREVAQAEVSQAEEIASSIALTAQTLKRIRQLGSN